MRRYFDEYRGLRETIGHVERIGVRSTVRDVRGARRARPPLDARARTAARRAVPLDRPLGRAPQRPQGVLGARLARRPPARAASSACCRWRAARDGAAPESPRRRRRPAGARAPAGAHAAHGYEAIARVLRDGPGAAARPGARAWPTASGCTSRSRSRRSRRLRRPRHHLPARRCGSSGWATRARSGCTTRSATGTAAGRRSCGARSSSTSRRSRRPCSAASTTGTAPTSSVATGWQTVFPLLELRRRAARARTSSTTTSPSSIATSVESSWAERDLPAQGLYGIAGSPWLRDLYVDRYGGAGRDVPVRRRPRRLLPAADRAPARHRRLLRARRSRRGARSRSAILALAGAAGAAGRTCGSCCSATASR